MTSVVTEDYGEGNDEFTFINIKAEFDSIYWLDNDKKLFI